MSFEEYAMVAQPDEDERAKRMDEIRQQFNDLDKDGSGTIEMDELAGGDEDMNNSLSARRAKNRRPLGPKVDELCSFLYSRKSRTSRACR